MPRNPISVPERLERGGPCWLLKLRCMGRGLKEDKWKCSFLGCFCWACRAGTRDFCSVLTALVGSSLPSTKYFFPHRTLFQLLNRHRLPIVRQAAVLGRLSLSMCLCSVLFCCAMSTQQNGFCFSDWLVSGSSLLLLPLTYPILS